MIMMLREQELIEQGREQGWEQGRKKGREEGREKGREEGRVEGREQGIVEGVQKGEARLAVLFGHLLSLGREQDAVRAVSDPEYRRQLYSEFNL